MAGPCFRLRFRGRELWLVPGTYDIGRSGSCQLRIDDGRVSRFHAELVVASATEATIRDCASINGVFVDGTRIGTDPEKLVPGTRIVIGGEVISVQAPSLPPPGREPMDTLTEEEPVDTHESTMREPLADLVETRWNPPSPPCADGSSVAPAGGAHTAETRRTDALEMYAPVARTAIEMGRSEDAEALMGAHLRAVLSRAQSGGAIPAEGVRRSVDLAVDLARAGRRGWFDFVVDLYDAVRVVPDGDVVARLEQAFERQPSVDAMRLSRWVQSLRGRVQSLRVDDLPTIDRLEALVGVAIRRGK